MPVARVCVSVIWMVAPEEIRPLLPVMLRGEIVVEGVVGGEFEEEGAGRVAEGERRQGEGGAAVAAGDGQGRAVGDGERAIDGDGVDAENPGGNCCRPGVAEGAVEVECTGAGLDQPAGEGAADGAVDDELGGQAQAGFETGSRAPHAKKVARHGLTARRSPLE